MERFWRDGFTKAVHARRTGPLIAEICAFLRILMLERIVRLGRTGGGRP